ncbi:MAG: hypothetical protein SNI05_08190 [Rikenellaceae bacterium]
MCRIFVLLTLLLSSILNLKGENVFDLKGKNIILTPIINTVGSVYCKSSLQKMKFKDEYLYQNDIAGKRVSVLDVIRINEGSNKNDAIVITLEYEQDTIALYCPLRFKPDENNIYKYYANIRRVQFPAATYYFTAFYDIHINYYDADKIDNITNAYQGKIVYANMGTYNIKENVLSSNLNSHISSYQPYIFNGFEFREQVISRDIEQTVLCARFHDLNGVETLLPVKNSDENIYCNIYRSNRIVEYISNINFLSLDNFAENILTEESLQKDCNRLTNIELLDYISDNYIDREVYITSNKYTYGVDVNMLKNNEYAQFSYMYKGNRYHTAKEVKLLKYDPKIAALKYYLITESVEPSGKTLKYAFPITAGLDKLIILASVQKEAEQIIELEQERKERERLAQIKKDEQEYKAKLIKQYGKANAELILKNQIKLGFTKQMCIESWGEPEDINKTITYYGTHEQWVYGLDTYIYFDNNKLTTIQN